MNKIEKQKQKYQDFVQKQYYKYEKLYKKEVRKWNKNHNKLIKCYDNDKKFRKLQYKLDKIACKERIYVEIQKEIATKWTRMYE